MKLIQLLVVILLFVSCSKKESEISPSNDELIANKITFRVGRKLEQEKKFKFEGFGVRGPSDVEGMFMGLKYYKTMDISEARHLIIECLDIYLNEINGNEEIRPYLHNYPFNFINIEIIITFPDIKNENKNIAAVSIDKGRLIYSIDKGKYFDAVLEETYEEALKKLQEEKEASTKASFDEE